jgi:NAD(P)-dependent dehydrogenase (short-subunit alcohol dehydrogenase family)
MAENRVALVTGASSGIGRAVAVALAGDGFALGLVGRDQQRLDATAAAVAVRSVTIARDLRSKDACAEVVDGCCTALGSVDILVSVAGGAANVDVLDLDADLVVPALEIKMLSTLWLAQLVAPKMRERGWGRIVTVAGAAGVDPQRDNLATSVSNVSVLNLTRALSDALAPHGITVNAICPGPTDTERWRGAAAARAEREGRSVDELRAAVERAIPARRLGRPEDVAAAVSFLVSEGASYVHGNALYLDGGGRRGIP